jgi:hypothetical protein
MLMGGASQKLSSVLSAELKISWPHHISMYMVVTQTLRHTLSVLLVCYFGIGGHFLSLSIVIQFYILVPMAYTKAKLARLQ